MRKKKIIIAIVLAAALVAGGLGSFAYAQEGPVNEVKACFPADWNYDVPGDTFTNHEVTGRRDWCAHISNHADETGAPVTAFTISLETGLVFDNFRRENLTKTGPPTYEWFFGNVPQDSGDGASVGFESPDVFPVSFTPGFDASRTADKTEFTEPDTQTLTITLTPRDVTEGLYINVDIWEDELVDAVITSPTTDEEQGIWLDPDGHGLNIGPTGLEIGTTYTYYVTIEVTPKVPQLEFMPDVKVTWDEELASGTTTGNLVSHAVEQMGTWTMSADGSYVWLWFTYITRRVSFEGYSRDMGNKVHAHFATNWIYTVLGDTFTNDEVTGGKTWAAHMWNEPDETGAPVAAVELSLASELEFDDIWPEENLVTLGPPTYEWFFGDVLEGPGLEGRVHGPTPDPFPVTFRPGFDASRSADKTEFTVPDTQTLTITLTPREVTEEFHIYVHAWEDELVNPVIVSPITDEEQGIWLSPDGHWLDIFPAGLEIGTTYTYNVTIEVTAKVPQVEFMPRVYIDWLEHLDSGTARGSSVSHTVEQVGTWAWSGEGSYVWHWDESLVRGVTFPRYRGNHVGVDFYSKGLYAVPGDTFINHEVTGSSEWAALISNWPDETGEPVAGLTLTLDSELEFDRVEDGNLVTMGPPAYEWSFGALPQESQTWENVRFLTPDLFPVTFTPGFDASRTLDKTMFWQSDGTQTQTLTIMVTPREEDVVTSGYWLIVVGADEEYTAPDEYDLVDAVITSPSGGDKYTIIIPTGLELDTTYTYYVTIEVTPKVPEVEFMPSVFIEWVEPSLSSRTTGSSVSHTVEQMGTWTWSAEGSYVWDWKEVFGRGVEWQPCCRVKIEDFAIKEMVIEFDPRPNHDKIDIKQATFRLPEGATCDLSVDDVTVTVDGVVTTIPAGSFVLGKGGDYIFKTPKGVEPKVEMKLNFDKGEWSFKVDKIDASVVDNLDGVDVTFSIGSMGASERIEMWIDRLLYEAGS